MAGPKAGRPGHPSVVFDAAIQFCLMVTALFSRPLRQTPGVVLRILEMAGLDWPVPDVSTLSRRQGTLVVNVSNRRVSGPIIALSLMEFSGSHGFVAQIL